MRRQLGIRPRDDGVGCMAGCAIFVIIIVIGLLVAGLLTGQSTLSFPVPQETVFPL